MTKEIVIIGGSLAGLMHGVMLKRRGLNVTILEQEPSGLREGYDAGIMFRGEVQNVLNRFDHVRQDFCVPADGPQFNLDRDGIPKFQYKKKGLLTNWNSLLCILRANFDGATSKLVTKIPEAGDKDGHTAFKIGARVTDVKDLGEKVQIQFEDTINHVTEMMQADIVIAADGSNSTVRKILMPKVQRQYTGFVTWRGTIREELLEETHLKVFQNKVTFHNTCSGYLVVYIIPNDEGDLRPGKRLINWVWYYELPEGSKDLSETMTDIHGKLHSGTVPRGAIRPEVWSKQKALAADMMPACIATAIERTQAPFVTKIQEVVSPEALFFDSKLFLVGDALITIRPNVAASTNQAAFDCLQLEKVFQGTLSSKRWERTVLRYGNAKVMWAVVFATIWTGKKLSLMWNLCRFVLLLVRQRLGFLS